MKLTKQFIEDVLRETVREYNEKVYNCTNDVEIRYISEEKFIGDALKNNLIQLQIKLGIYKDFKNEYPNFLVVYNEDKNVIRKFINLPYKISICFEKACDILNQFDEDEVRLYLKRCSAHEITHLFEDEIIEDKKYKQLWNKCLSDSRGNLQASNEQLAESIADMIVSEGDVKHISEKIWQGVNKNIENIRRIKH